MNQNYIKIFENSGGSVTIRYAAHDDNDDQTLDISTIAFSVDDLPEIAHYLLHLHEELSEE